MNEQQQQQQKPDTSENVSAAKLHAILHVLFAGIDEMTDDSQLEENRQRAKAILDMPDQEVMKLLEQPSQHAREGDFIQAVRVE